MKSFEEQYNEYAQAFESALKEYCAKMNYCPNVLTESMRYSLLLGGKRVRPVLFLSALDLFGLNWKNELDIAIAIEMIHTYSLIHDDLPAMDNDDFRRGKPSCHKRFGEAHAILAGDALLSYAFDLLLREAVRGEQYLRAAKILSEAAGAEGMISGQSYDISFTGKSLGKEELITVYKRKTGALIAAGLKMACAIAQKNEQIAAEYGENLGILFQLTDDFIDEYGESDEAGKTLGKDKRADKLTCIKVFGLERAEALADEYADKCRVALRGFDGDACFFDRLIDCVRDRTK